MAGVIHCYEIEVVGEETYRYTDSEEVEHLFGHSFQPRPISHSDVSQTEDSRKAEVKVTADLDLPYAEEYRGDRAASKTLIRIWAVPMPGQPGPGELTKTDSIVDALAEFLDPSDRGPTPELLWQGVVGAITIDSGKTVLPCKSGAAAAKRLGLSRRFQRSCPHALYSEDACKAIRVTHTVAVTAISESVVSVTVPTEDYRGPESYFNGEIEYVRTDGRTVRRVVSECAQGINGLELTLAEATRVPVGTIVTLSRGCLHTTASCAAHHDNIQNFGGCFDIPVSTPTEKVSTFY